MQRFFLSPVDDKPLKYQHILGIVNVALASTIDAIPVSTSISIVSAAAWPPTEVER